MLEAERASVVMFVDGNVGLRAARVALSRNPESILAFVTLGGKENISNQHRHIVFDEANIEKTETDLRELGADVFILAWWPKILREKTLRLGQKFTLNFHPSLLPHNRGKDPNFWAIKDDTPLGVTIHHVDAGIDTGDIAFQARIDRDWCDDGKTLYEKSCTRMVSLFADSFPKILSLKIPKIKQDAVGVGSLHVRASLDKASKIDLENKYSGREILNLLRAKTFVPHPGCRFVDKGEIYEVHISINKVGPSTR